MMALIGDHHAEGTRNADDWIAKRAEALVAESHGFFIGMGPDGILFLFS